MDLEEKLARLRERRWYVAHWLGSEHHTERLVELERLQISIAALEAVIAEGRPAPEPVDARALFF